MVQNRLQLTDIAGDGLVDLCEHIMHTYRRDPSAIDGAVYARLAEQLLAAEVQPGGPYKDEAGNSTLTLNATIGRLFILIGKPLPNIDAYLAQFSHKRLSRGDQEILKRYRLAKTNPPETKKFSERHSAYQRAEKTLEALAEPTRTQALQFLARVETADVTGEIATFADFANEALSANVTTIKLNKLGEANIHSWIAYTIYDHILDKEADPMLLPVANVCMRLAINLYRQSLPVRHPLQILITDYFNRVDTTSVWELTACRLSIRDGSIIIPRLPDYKQYETLAWRSCIHILGPIIVASTTLPAAKMDYFMKGLRHYLIARQLADDIHDWREDLAAGRISAAVALLLTRQNIGPDSIHSLEQLTVNIQKDFLQDGAEEICQLILHHTRQAHSLLIASGCKTDSSILALITRLEAMATSSMHQQTRFLEFKNAYQVRNHSSHLPLQ